jgi:hypothetical protein
VSEESSWLAQAVDGLKRLQEGWKIFEWFRKKFTAPKPTTPDQPGEPTKGILIIGPGGTGKTTLAKLLSGQLNAWVFGDAWKYAESYAQEHYALIAEPGIELVVPAGQEYRQSISEARADIVGGRYSGVIVVGAFGHHNESGLGYKSHALYQGNKERFLEAFLAAKVEEERKVIELLRPALEDAPGKLWLLTVVTKQDLWWDRRQEASASYLIHDPVDCVRLPGLPSIRVRTRCRTVW